MYLSNELAARTFSTLDSAYKWIIPYVWTSGEWVKDERGNWTKEIQNLTFRLAGPGNDYPTLGPTTMRFGCDLGNSLIMTDVAQAKAREFLYSYGERLRRNGAYEKLIKKIRECPQSRRMVIPVYLPEDHDCDEVPCVVMVQFIVRNGKLDLTVVMRSNDLVKAMPADVLGYRMFQHHVAMVARVEIGTYTHHAVSAHIIAEHDQEFAEQLVSERAYR